MNPDVRDALRRFAEGDPNVRIVMPDVPTMDDHGRPAGVGVDLSGADLDLPPVIYLAPDDDQEAR